ncbi:DUF2314 domain-containing protein [Prosthecobacter fusiformis]|uniref:DUF2314 domain-containing protein n=1 Tax=Prosthecobacter fusiformis TaxID=48464 RepID=UPI001415276F|nr:DUF2314 domain-containing protein [Prosthecobacter fusiformis]
MHQPWRYIFAGIAVVLSIALIGRARWAILPGVIALSVFALAKIQLVFDGSFTWRTLIAAIGLLFAARGLWKNPDANIFTDDENDEPPPAAPEDMPAQDHDEKPLISLVQLRSSPRYLEPEVLAHALSEAWELKITSDKEESENADGFISHAGPVYMIMVTKPVFIFFTLHNHDSPYFDDPEELAEKVSNLRFSEIIRSHSAWLSLDFIQSSNSTFAADKAYQMIGKAIAALADDQTQAVFCPQHNHFNLWSSELEKTLTGDNPLGVFREEVKAAVIRVQGSGSMEEAIQKARQRWHEFVSAFNVREPGDTRFIIKAPFTSDEGDTEHMWVEVFGVEPEYVHGHLLNDPFHHKKLKSGSQVEVPVAEVSDWICPDADGNPLGNFTSHIVHEAARNKSSN